MRLKNQKVSPYGSDVEDASPLKPATTSQTEATEPEKSAIESEVTSAIQVKLGELEYIRESALANMRETRRQSPIRES